MAKEQYLIDTCVLIALFRGDKSTMTLIEKLRGRIVISVITEMELYRGAKTKGRKKELTEQLRYYAKAIIDADTCIQAIQIMKKYNTGHRDVFVADCLIAATALVNDLILLTYNKKDFDFIEGIRIN